MSRRLAALAVAAAALLMACGNQGAAGARSSSPTPTSAAEEASPAAPSPAPTPDRQAATPLPTPTVAPAPPVVDLTFTGSIATRVRSATSTPPCGRGIAGFDAELNLTLSGQPSLLSIALFDYHGPGSYAIPPQRVSVRVGPPSNGQLLPATKGTVTVSADERSGRIDTALADGGTHVSGTWACT